MATQDIRHSQFVITYGPGAILEGHRGPRIILNPAHGLFVGGTRSDQLEIPSRRLAGIMPGVRIYRPPITGEATWATNPFPGWALCIDHWILYLGRCPKCQ